MVLKKIDREKGKQDECQGVAGRLRETVNCSNGRTDKIENISNRGTAKAKTKDLRARVEKKGHYTKSKYHGWKGDVLTKGKDQRVKMSITTRERFSEDVRGYNRVHVQALAYKGIPRPKRVLQRGKSSMQKGQGHYLF